MDLLPLQDFTLPQSSNLGQEAEEEEGGEWVGEQEPLILLILHLQAHGQADPTQ